MGKDGKPKADGNTSSHPNAATVYSIPPGVTADQLQDATIPVAIVEGEKKALALWRLACHETEAPRFIPVGIADV